MVPGGDTVDGLASFMGWDRPARPHKKLSENVKGRSSQKRSVNHGQSLYVAFIQRKLLVSKVKVFRSNPAYPNTRHRKLFKKWYIFQGVRSKCTVGDVGST